MVDERAPALAHRLTAHARVLRRGRIFARLDEATAAEKLKWRSGALGRRRSPAPKRLGRATKNFRA
jgi:hypothetical protein